METEEEPFEVPALRVGEVHRMIRPCSKETEELCGLTRIPDGAEDDLLEEYRIDGIRAGEGGKESPFPKAPRRLEIDLLVTPGRPTHILPRFGKSGRIEDDHIEGFFRLS
jgi:hypothetical protein